MKQRLWLCWRVATRRRPAGRQSKERDSRGNGPVQGRSREVRGGAGMRRWAQGRRQRRKQPDQATRATRERRWGGFRSHRSASSFGQVALSHRVKGVPDWRERSGLPQVSLRIYWTHTVWHFARMASLGVKPGLQLPWRRGNGAPAAGRDDSALGFVESVLTALRSPQSLTPIPGSIKPMSGLRA